MATKVRSTLTEGRVGAHLVKLTVPMIWGVFAIIAFNLADTYFVGQLGTQPLAAMSFTFPVVSALGSLAMGLGVGASSIIARAIGEGDRARVQRLTTDSLTLALLIVGAFILVGVNTIDPLFTALGADSQTLPLVRDYMQIWYLGIIFLVVPMVGTSAMRAAGNTTVPSAIMTIAAAINITLDPLFILGWGGFPRLELQGAAIATVLSRATTFVAALLFLHFRERMLCFNLPPFKVVLKSWRQILHVGLPAAGTSLVTPISIGFITSLMASYGAVAVAGFGIASRVEAFSLIVLLALSSIIGPFVGQNWGAQKYDRVYRALNLSFIFCVVWGIFVAVVLLVAAPGLAAQFDDNPEVVAIAVNYLWVVPFSYGAAGIILIASSTFNALGKPLPSVIMTLSRMFGLYIPLAYIGSWLFGVRGVFWAAGLANLIVGIGAYLWNQRTCHKH
ncbi:MATE family efflux transporter [Lusitaniella coriacea LEGE 07157]|uniref:MATE family efflux transporter n=1 Tax=Lusitaniella coriacea LEGE 07157 TaxID=945747 RepID=A0A8J7DXU7_9CYAN|nr:MATE family efflux transporter [Lusitaniella coriacea]MBE9117188.1 MATE family efflux transporter [Lusitaniella coriacea LEGE 07157]